MSQMLTQNSNFPLIFVIKHHEYSDFIPVKYLQVLPIVNPFDFEDLLVSGIFP